ncbi:CAP domain-containing protein [Phytoactinopolyspora halotolerans]|uniref:SCP domain-containing protein n=1 Tax=Phytoactinopolyspora halotolerans TaxID=1981512 RepID=A0A6L9S2S5_9ACTN|nr:CAP domain-containing protein [Phytoactinopolyspora halotolerans]NED98737.1 hypothetical protein [Phytoactinopolyspora halotolerans]
MTSAYVAVREYEPSVDDVHTLSGPAKHTHGALTLDDGVPGDPGDDAGPTAEPRDRLVPEQDPETVAPDDRSDGGSQPDGQLGDADPAPRSTSEGRGGTRDGTPTSRRTPDEAPPHSEPTGQPDAPPPSREPDAPPSSEEPDAPSHSPTAAPTPEPTQTYTVPPQQRPTAEPSPTPSDPPRRMPPALTSAEQAVLEATNHVRREAGCPDLRVNAELVDAAREHTADMRSHRYYSHVGPDGRGPQERARAAGYRGEVEENIARGIRGGDAVVDRWTKDAEARQKITDCAYTEIGVANERGLLTQWWTQVLGRR